MLVLEAVGRKFPERGAETPVLEAAEKGEKSKGVGTGLC